MNPSHYSKQFPAPTYSANGTHFLIEIEGVQREILSSQKLLRSALHNAAQAGNATLVDEIWHSYTPEGVSGVLLVAESHLSIHTWPEKNYAAIDFYTCGTAPDIASITEVLQQALQTTSIRTQTIQRGPKLK